LNLYPLKLKTQESAFKRLNTREYLFHTQKYPEAPTKNGRWIKKTVYNLPSYKIFVFAPALTRQGARGSGFARAIAPVPTNFHGGFTALLYKSTFYLSLDHP